MQCRTATLCREGICSALLDLQSSSDDELEAIVTFALLRICSNSSCSCPCCCCWQDEVVHLLSIAQLGGRCQTVSEVLHWLWMSGAIKATHRDKGNGNGGGGSMAQDAGNSGEGRQENTLSLSVTEEMSFSFLLQRQTGNLNFSFKWCS